jgi:hypothetical protein
LKKVIPLLTCVDSKPNAKTITENVKKSLAPLAQGEKSRPELY